MLTTSGVVGYFACFKWFVFDSCLLCVCDLRCFEIWCLLVVMVIWVWFGYCGFVWFMVVIIAACSCIVAILVVCSLVLVFCGVWLVEFVVFAGFVGLWLAVLLCGVGRCL